MRFCRARQTKSISAFEAGSESVFQVGLLMWIAGLSTQIFDNLVGREVEEL